jgi:hypothetical protein
MVGRCRLGSSRVRILWSRMSPFVCVINKNTHIRMCVIGELRKSAGAIIIVDEDSNYNYSEKDSRG